MCRSNLVYIAIAIGILSGYAIPSATCADDVTEISRPIAYFNRYGGWYGFPVDANADGSMLAREIVRQAVMIAARDELGMLTRDVLFSEWPPRDEKKTYDVFSFYGKKDPHISVVQGLKPSPKILLEAPTTYHSPLDYPRLIEQMEQLSRTKFVDAMKSSISDPASLPPRPKGKPARVSDEMEDLLSEMSFVSQFIAVRRLHAAIYEGHTSPDLLAALVRGYAHLGLMSEYLAHPLDVGFRARSLLYAQRMVAADPKSAFAREHQAYALALLGYHRLALKALAEAESMRKEHPEVAGPRVPWTDLIGHFCRYESSQITAPVGLDSLKQLAGLLRFRSMLAASPASSEIKAGLAALEDAPECYAIYDRLCAAGGVQLGHTTTVAGALKMSATLYARIAAMPDAPEAALSSAHSLEETEGPLGLAFAGREVPDSAVALHSKMMDALLNAGAEENASQKSQGTDLNSNSDQVATQTTTNEFTYTVLGRMIEETIFKFVVHRVYFESGKLGVAPDETLTRLQPFYRDNRYAPYVDSVSWDPKRKAAAIQKLPKAYRPQVIDIRSLYIFIPAGQQNEKLWQEWLTRAYSNMSETPFDFWCLARYASEPKRIEYAKRLQTISEFCPMARRELVRLDWDHAKNLAAKWEQESIPDHPSVLLALAEAYSNHEMYNDAERCYKAALENDESIETYRLLAKLYYKQDKIDLWLKALNDALQQPDFALTHASIHSEIAWHYIRQRKWDEALPHAEEAAGTGSEWGFVVAATVHEAKQQWEQAEALYQACSMRYRGGVFRWYSFCRRTGHGNLEAAKELADTAVARSEYGKSVNGLILYRILNKQEDLAIKLLDTQFKKKPQITSGLLLALLADRQKDAERRDSVLTEIAAAGQKLVETEDGAGYKELVSLAATFAKDLAAGGSASFDLEQFKKPQSAENLRPYYYYALAAYLDQHGKPDEAIGLWKKAIDCTPSSEDFYRTLSGAELSAHGIGSE